MLRVQRKSFYLFPQAFEKNSLQPFIEHFYQPSRRATVKEYFKFHYMYSSKILTQSVEFYKNVLDWKITQK